MRKIFTLFLMLIASYCFAQFADTSGNILICKTPGLNIMPTNKDTSQAPVRIRFHCHRTLTSADEPLFVVDGIPFENGKFSNLKFVDIDSIWILKGATATALYGSQGANGVIIITTKGTTPRKFIIKDFLDGSRLAGATVSFTSVINRDEKFQFVANDSGMVVTDKLNRFGKYQMIVSSVGHITLQQVFENRIDLKKEDIFLVREIKICDEVIVSSGHGFGCRLACGFTTYRKEGSGTTIIAGADKKEQALVVPFEFKVYPNPVQKCASLNVQFDNTGRKEKIVRVISLEGRTLLRQSFNTSKGKNVFKFPTDARWAAGIYFVQLLYENGRVAASEKVIIR